MTIFEKQWHWPYGSLKLFIPTTSYTSSPSNPPKCFITLKEEIMNGRSRSSDEGE